jgi:hypothetical protein
MLVRRILIDINPLQQSNAADDNVDDACRLPSESIAASFPPQLDAVRLADDPQHESR